MDFSLLECSIQYNFKDKNLLREALVHPSFMQSKFENLEFIGDRVLSLCIADMLWFQNPKNEKEYARLFTSLTGSESLRLAAFSIGLNKYVQWRGCPSHSNTIFADACEAFLGALYLDAGLDHVKQFIKEIWTSIKSPSFEEIDPKTIVQNFVNQNNLDNPIYSIISEKGEPHDKIYTVNLKLKNKIYIGFGKSVRSAEKDAAHNFLKEKNDKKC